MEGVCFEIKMPTKDINLGYILAKLVPAFFIGTPGIIFLFFEPPIGVVLLTISICLLCLRSGIEIDVANKQIRKYSALNKWKVGEWVSLTPFKHMILDYTNETKGMSLKYNYSTVQTKSFELIFLNMEDEASPLDRKSVV